jgi:o-succinylbenzoate synthase
MNKIELFYAPYTISFNKTFTNSNGNFAERNGFIVKLESSSGKIGIGDSAPFPEYGSETYEDDENFLDNFNINLNLDLNNIEQSIGENLNSFDSLPCLKHGFEQALLSLVCNEKGISINELLNVQSKKKINVNAVLGFLSPKESAEAALKKIEDGFKTIKIKIGRDNFDEDYKCIEALRKSCGNEINIRADVNGKWEWDKAVKNIQALEEFNLEYVEQPVNTLNDFVELSKKVKTPLAVDESIRNTADAEKFISNKAASVLVLKPMMLGGIIPTIKIIKMAEQAGIKSVITTSFESVIGRASSVFAASLIKEDTAHGLDTDIYFEKDLFSNPYPVIYGKILLGN